MIDMERRFSHERERPSTNPPTSRTRKALEEVSEELMNMPKWKLKLKFFLHRYSNNFGELQYGMNPDWKMPFDVILVRKIRSMLWKK